MALPALIFAVLGCGEPAAPRPEEGTAFRPDVLLVTIDTLRADRVGCYGDGLARTPNLDRLASQGALFREAHATVPLTLPSHASLLTGLPPRKHGLRDNAGYRLPDAVTTLAEALAAAGYATGAFVSAFVLDSAWGLDQGFDVYRDPFHPQEVGKAGPFGQVELPSAEVVNAAAAWWKISKGPRFAWVHLYDPHAPWAAHPGGPVDPYRGEVAFADGLLGRLIEAAGPGALVVATSDHGEGLWDHGEREHGVLLGRSVTRVPLIVRPPGGLDGSASAAARPGESAARRPENADAGLDLAPVPDAPRAARVVEAPVSLIDVSATIADYAGADAFGDGFSLRAAVEGSAAPERPVTAETFYPLFHYGWSGLRMAEDWERRVEVGTRVVATDWPTDPMGLRPTGEDVPVLVAAANAGAGEDPERPGPLDSRSAEALAALGYATTVLAAPAEPPDPRDRIEVLGEMHVAEGIADPAKAVAALASLVARAPELADARVALSLARLATGDVQGAWADTAAVLDRFPDHPSALHNGALLAHQAGDSERALALARRMVAINPNDPRGYRAEAIVWVDRENPEEVLRVATAGLRADPDDPNLHYLAALSEVHIGDPLRAVAHLEAARRNGTVAKDVALWTAHAYEKAGKVDDAKRAYEQATREMPDDPRPWAMAGWMLYQAGRCDEARPFLVNVARRGGRGDPKVAEALEACGEHAGTR